MIKGRARFSPVDDCHIQTILYRANKEHGTFLQKRYFIMFLQEHAVLFLQLFYLDSEERYKTTTPNCGSLGEEKVVCFVIVSIYAILV